MQSVQMCKVHCLFSNRGTCVSPDFFPNVVGEQNLSVHVHVGDRTWSSNKYISSMSDQIQQDCISSPSAAAAAAGQSPAIAEACKTACAAAHGSGPCTCTHLGPYSATLTWKSYNNQPCVTGIVHGDQLLPYRPETPNHRVKLILKVSSVLNSRVLC